MDEDEARVAALTKLRDDLDNSAQLRLVRDFEGVRQTNRVFLGNERELSEFLIKTSEPSVALQIWNLDNRPLFNRFLDEVDRLLHNYVAAAGSLRDHTRRVWKKYLPADDYEDHARATFAESGVSMFVQKLRNYSLHARLPIAQGHMSWERDKELKATVKLRRGELLGWSGWNASARAYIEGFADEDIELPSVVTAYTSVVIDFTEWFDAEFQQRRAADLDYVREQQDAFRQGLEELDRFRASKAQG
jgi:hypothetical protein